MKKDVVNMLFQAMLDELEKRNVGKALRIANGLGKSGILVCENTETGKLSWKYDESLSKLI